MGVGILKPQEPLGPQGFSGMKEKEGITKMREKMCKRKEYMWKKGKRYVWERKKEGINK